ncbi:hypothetical protein [Draconibacterium sediminis]|uniref:hypothetical protein n=1 Tax=Draconibacterium sediminis TaxID=1544798 RepID=UPI0026F0145C|nr:hypothetical protein [Draconibacterium sediminis]
MKRIIGFSVIAVAIFMFSCNTNTDEGIDIPGMSDEQTLKSAEITVAEVQAEAAVAECNYEVEFFANAERILTRWWQMGKFFGWHNKLRYFENQCPDVTIDHSDSTAYPLTITLYYGDSTVLNNGKVLSGEIVLVISAPRNSQDYSRLVSFNDFMVDSMLINGTTEVIVDKVDSTFRKFESELTFVYPDGTTVTRSAERVWQWLAGLDTPEIQSDDVVIITGEVTGTIVWPDGTEETYSKIITTPLKRLAMCRYMVEGVVEVRIDGNLVSVLDYGYNESGEECDHYALLSTNAGDEVIDLSEKHYNGMAKQYQYRNQHQYTGENGNQNGSQNQNNNHNGNG